MPGTKIDGNLIAQSVKDRVKKSVDILKSRGVNPCLATVLVGDDPASATYVKNKHRACQEVGIATRDHRLESASQDELNQLVERLSCDGAVHGILVQMPLPAGLDAFETVSRILPTKDVDGLTPHNAGLLSMKKAALIACTPSGIMEMFDFCNIGLAGKHVVIINRSGLVGRPLFNLLLERDATVTVCHSKSRDIAGHCRSADIVITGVGNRDAFELAPDMIRDGAIVIDVAISRRGGKLAGDADYDEIIKKASYATPVPGGVGPMTVAMLLKNTVMAASLSGGLGPGS